MRFTITYCPVTKTDYFGRCPSDTGEITVSYTHLDVYKRQYKLYHLTENTFVELVDAL